MFTKNVASGRFTLQILVRLRLIKNLDTAPIPPPKNIAIRLSMDF